MNSNNKDVLRHFYTLFAKAVESNEPNIKEALGTLMMLVALYDNNESVENDLMRSLENKISQLEDEVKHLQLMINRNTATNPSYLPPMPAPSYPKPTIPANPYDPIIWRVQSNTNS